MAITSADFLAVFDPKDDGLPAIPTIAQTQRQSNFIGTPGLPGTGGDLRNTVTNTDQGGAVTRFINNTLINPSVGVDNVLSGNSINAPSTPAPKSAGLSSTISDFFLRGTIIILGFIFVAVGLSMFKNNSIIESVKKVGK